MESRLYHKSTPTLMVLISHHDPVLLSHVVSHSTRRSDKGGEWVNRGDSLGLFTAKNFPLRIEPIL
jgi:hypothetical protein